MRRVALIASLWLAAAAEGAGPSVSASPGAVVLGSGATVTLESSSPLHAKAALGELRAEDGDDALASRWTWTPPAIRHPATALLFFWADEEPTDVTILRIPLIGRTELQIDTEPRAEVRVEIDGTRFGPVKADGRGRVAIPVEVPPGVSRARVLASVNGNQSTREVALDVPDTNELAVAIAPSPLRAGQPAVVVVASARPRKVFADASDGDLSSKDERESETVFRLAPRQGAKTIRVHASAHGNGAVADASAEVSTDAPPARFRLLPSAHVGGFYGGGASTGPAGGVGLSFAVRSRWFIEADTDLRSLGGSFAVSSVGRVDSHVWALSALGGARFRAWERQRLAVDVRAGLGALLFQHTLRGTGQPAFTEAGVRPDALVGVQVAFSVGRFEPYAQLAVEYGAVRAMEVDARAGGVALAVGTRYAIP